MYIEYAVRLNGKGVIEASVTPDRAKAEAFAWGYVEGIYDAGLPSRDVSLVALRDGEFLSVVREGF